MKMSTVNIKIHHWKCNGLKIQTEIKIPAWGKHYNQNKVVLTFFFFLSPVEAILESSAWRQQVVMLVGNADFNLFIYFPPQRTIAGLWNQQYNSAADARQYASCCSFWNAVSYHLSQLCNLAENPPGNIKIQLLKHFYFWKLFMSFYIFLAYIKFLGSSGLDVHLMDDWGGAFFSSKCWNRKTADAAVWQNYCGFL